MRYITAILFVLVATSVVPADALQLKEARKRLLAGNYAEAVQIYEGLTKKEGFQVPAAVGLARSWRCTGEYDKALAALDAALKDQPNNADLLAQRADVLLTRGRWEEAEKAAVQALKSSNYQ